MLKKAYGNDSRSRRVLPVSMAENESEGSSFCRFRWGDPKCDEATERRLKNIFQENINSYMNATNVCG
ncbi:hypothetical protein TNCV_2200761 [Trichonephila clavipes]|nr:hypothetical protein TNCV_2200761 [Trichonephila clavipes]